MIPITRGHLGAALVTAAAIHAGAAALTRSAVEPADDSPAPDVLYLELVPLGDAQGALVERAGPAADAAAPVTPLDAIPEVAPLAAPAPPQRAPELPILDPRSAPRQARPVVAPPDPVLARATPPRSTPTPLREIAASAGPAAKVPAAAVSPPAQMADLAPPRSAVAPARKTGSVSRHGPSRDDGPQNVSLSLVRYGAALHDRIAARAKHYYPRHALRRGEEGFVLARIKLDPSGNLLVVELGAETAASSALVRAAERAIKASAPFPRFAADMRDGPRWFDVPVRFRIADREN